MILTFRPGDNNFGQLGDGTTTHRTSPAQIGTATNRIGTGEMGSDAGDSVVFATS